MQIIELNCIYHVFLSLSLHFMNVYFIINVDSKLLSSYVDIKQINYNLPFKAKRQ